MPLTIAREIAGVRAVFGETYPDPVRVVSVGVEVDELLANVKDQRWQSVSVEFCGGTHVRSTGDIKDLVILEESGIAKGIRRMVAVTGEDANEAQKLADDFSERLDRLEKTQYSSKKEAESKALQQELAGLSVSAVRKSQFRERSLKIGKSILDEQKKMQKEESKKAIDAISEHFSKNKEATSAVLRLPVSGNPKVVPEVIKHVQSKLKEKTVYVFAADESDGQGKVVHGCFVSPVSPPISGCFHVYSSMSGSPCDAFAMTFILCGDFHVFAIDHRTRKTGLPVRSAVLKPRAGWLVVGWVTTSESQLLIVFGFLPDGTLNRELDFWFSARTHHLPGCKEPCLLFNISQLVQQVILVIGHLAIPPPGTRCIIQLSQLLVHAPASIEDGVNTCSDPSI